MSIYKLAEALLFHVKIRGPDTQIKFIRNLICSLIGGLKASNNFISVLFHEKNTKVLKRLYFFILNPIFAALEPER